MNSAAERRITTDRRSVFYNARMEAAAPPDHAHHWLIEPPNKGEGDLGAVCKVCGALRTYARYPLSIRYLVSQGERLKLDA